MTAMFQDKYVFAQLTAFLNRTQFNNYVRKYDGNRYVKHFTCWNQLLAMMFGQLSNRESLRDLIVAFEAHRAKQYHLGLGRKPIAKTTFASANQNRDYRIFEDFAFYMMEQARKKRVTDIFKLKGNVYAFDSTTIPLCLSVFWWAKFRKKKGGIKAHVLYDLESQVPAFFHISTASVYDSKAMKEIPYESGSYYVFDRGYNYPYDYILTFIPYIHLQWPSYTTCMQGFHWLLPHTHFDSRVLVYIAPLNSLFLHIPLHRQMP